MKPLTTSRFAIVTVLLIVLTSLMVAQDSGPAVPDQTEIIIPEFVLRVEELGVEEVEAVLPSETELALGQITLPLPCVEGKPEREAQLG